MKRLYLAVGLAALFLAVFRLSGQSNGSNVAITSSNGVVIFKNVGSQGIVAFAAHIQLQRDVNEPADRVHPTLLLRHDHYFKPDFAPGQTTDHDMISDFDRQNLPGHTFAKVTANMVWVQFADGSEWGDNSDSAIQSMFQDRRDRKALLQQLKAASSSQAQVDSILTSVTPGSFAEKYAIHLRGEEKELGYNMLVTHINDQVNAAATRKF